MFDIKKVVTILLAIISKLRGNRMTPNCFLKLKRTKETFDGILGIMEAGTFTCFTVENRSKAVPAGIYDVYFSWSGRFQRMTPHLKVPFRTEIEIHNANYPRQLSGCIAIGDRQEADAVDDSIDTDKKLEDLLRLQTNIKIQIFDISKS